MRYSTEDKLVHFHYKGVNWYSKDHPEGLATLVIANGCCHNCKNCINEELKQRESFSDYIDDAVDSWLTESLSDKLVLGGLEWTEQEDELYALLNVCQEQRINVILYTHWSEEELKERFPKLLEYNMWIKYGEYREDLKSDSYYSHGIKLASTNQYIKKNVVDTKK